MCNLQFFYFTRFKLWGASNLFGNNYELKGALYLIYFLHFLGILFLVGLQNSTQKCDKLNLSTFTLLLTCRQNAAIVSVALALSGHPLLELAVCFMHQTSSPITTRSFPMNSFLKIVRIHKYLGFCNGQRRSCQLHLLIIISRVWLYKFITFLCL